MQTLTQRETQIAQWLAWGYSDKEIADKAFISYQTVRTHHKNIYAKIKARNLADLTRWVFKIERRAVMAMMLLFIVITMELFDIQALRSRSVRASRIARSRSNSRTRKTYHL